MAIFKIGNRIVTKDEYEQFIYSIPQEREEITETDVIYKMASLLLSNKPQAKKGGFVLDLVYENGGFSWQYFADPNYSPSQAGTYTDPIPYTDGISVESGKWYILEDGNIWECIKTDSTSHMTSEWFDIVA